MPFLENNVDFTITAALPSTVTKEAAIAILHDHEVIIHCDRNLVKFEPLTGADQKDPNSVSKELKPTGLTKSYKIFDIVQNIPKGVWGSNVETLAEYTDLESGLFTCSKSALSVRIESEMVIEEGDGGEGLKLVCRSKLFGSRLLLPVIKGSCKDNMEDLIAEIVKKIEGK